MSTAPARPTRPQPVSAPTAAGWRVVVVDDSPDDRADVRRLLLTGSERRYQFAEAETGAAAVRAVLDAPAGPPDCLLLDYHLPDMDAPEVLAALPGPDGLTVCPVVVVTGSAGGDMGRAVLRAGAQDYIGKDWLTPQGLTRAVENAAERWHMARELRERDAALRAGEERFRRLMTVLPTAVYACDADGRITYFNDRAAELWGRSPRLGDPDERFCGAFRLLRPDGRPMPHDQSPMAAAVRDGRGCRNEEAVVERPDGGRSHVLVNIDTLRDADGRIAGAINAFSDVTDRKRAEEALRVRHAHTAVVSRTAARLVLRQSDGPDDLAAAAFRDLAGVLGVELYFNYLAGPEPDTLRLVSWAGLTADQQDHFARLRFGEYLCGAVAAARRPVVLDHIEGTDFEAASGLRAMGVRAYAGFPLLAGDEVLGTIAFATARRPAFTPDEVGLMQTACDLLAAALHRDRLAAVVADNEERFHLAFAAVSAVIYDWDIAADRVMRSAELQSLLGYENSEPGVATNTWYLAQLHPDDAPRAAGVVRDAIAGGADRFEDEYRMRHKDGHYVWVRDCGLFLKDAAGRATRCVGSVTSIDRRKEAEERLRRSEERFHLAVRAVTGVVWEWDLRTGHVYRSDGLFALTGVRPEDAAPTRDWWADRIHPDDLARLTATAGDLLATAGQFSGDYRVRHADGRWVDVWERGLVESGPDGRPVRLVGFTADVTDRKRAEAELARSEAFARSVVESSADCVKGLTPDGRLLWMNENGRRLMEVCDFDALRGCDWAAFWDQGGVRPEAEAALAAARAGGVGRFRGFCPTAAGSPRWWDVAVTPVPGPDGTVEQLLSVSRDVTDARAAEQRLAESEQRFRIMADGLPFPVWVHDPAGRLRLINRTYCDYFGVTAEQVLDEGWRPLVHPDDREEYVGSFLLAVRERTPWSRPCRVRRAGGDEWRWIESSARPHYSSDGGYLGMVGCSPDVTERERAQATLRARERELQTLADNTPDVLTRFDRGLRHVFVNAAVEKATGRPRAEFLGRTNRDLGMPADQCDRWDAALMAVFESGQHRSLEFTFDGPAGVRHYAARLVPEFGPDGAVEFVLGVTHDVTDRRRFEQTLADQDKRKDEFLATLAHELRNPLAPIRNGLQVLRLSGEATGAVAKARDMMDRQLGHLVNLVDDLLDISRVSQGKITLKRERLTVREAVEAAVEACRPTVDAKHHTLATDLPAEPLAVDGDRTRLVQVVSNLLTNAAKYSDDGGRITVSARREGGEAVVSVTDTGLGIAPELLPTLWDMFTQVRDTLDKAQGGLGIGLSLVKKLVEMHGGTVAAASAGVGFGSTFTVRLPLAAEVPRPLDTPTGGTGRGMRRPTPGRRILVVDDNRDGAESLAMMLGLFGHRTNTAHDGVAALAAARAFGPEVVFLDIGLPGMDGYEVARRLRADPDTAGATLVALTGWGSEDDKRRSKEVGFDHHLTKPVDAAEVTALLADRSGAGGWRKAAGDA